MTYVREDISKKLHYTSFIAALAVVLVHSNTLPLEIASGSGWAVWFENAVGYLQLWAVPYFFVVAGFFFDRGYAASEQRTSSFLKSKGSTLLVPYLLWGCLWGAITMTPIKYIANQRHGMAWQGTIFADPNWLLVADRFLAFTRSAPPNLALWFVRLLLLFFLLAPVWRYLRRKARPMIPLLGVFLLECSSSWGVEVLGGFEIRLSGVGFLLLGMSASIWHLEEIKLPKFVIGICFGLWAFIWYSSVQMCRFSEMPIDRYWLLLFRLSPILLLVVVWSLLDEREMAFLYDLISARTASLAFWIYCMHHPICVAVRAGLNRLFGRSLPVEIVKMVVIFLLATIIVVFCGETLRARVPKVYALLTGGRGER